MAMNKKEAAELEAAKKEVFVARALNWTEAVEPDLLPPKFGQIMVRGFLFNAYSGCVVYALSGASSHATNYEKFPEQTTSQQSRHLYSTRLIALRALRHEVEKQCALKLAEIDMEIEKEKLNVS